MSMIYIIILINISNCKITIMYMDKFIMHSQARLSCIIIIIIPHSYYTKTQKSSYLIIIHVG